MAHRVTAFITPHGYGHAAIVTSVLNALWRRRSDLSITLVSTVPEAVLRQRMNAPFAYVAHAGAADFGLLMTSSTDVLAAESLRAYQTAHRDWEALVEAEAAVLRRTRADVVLSSAGYACLAAARRLNIPALAVGPFSWLSIAEAFFRERPGADAVLAQMRAAYEGAEAVLETAPAVPSGFSNAVAVGPVGGPVAADRRATRERLGLAPSDILALASMGGIPDQLDMTCWHRPGVRWLTSGGAAPSGITPVAEVGLSVAEAVAVADVVLTKPGYGTFVEAACAGTHILYKARPDWPETAGLHAWAARHVGVECIEPDTITSGAFADKLHKLVQVPTQPLPDPSGNVQVADILLKYIDFKSFA